MRTGTVLTPRSARPLVGESAPSVCQTPPGLSVFNVFTVYESIAAGVRAQAMRCRLAAALNQETTLGGEAWNFAWLADRGLSREASLKAASADMIVISFDGLAELPRQVVHLVKNLPPARAGLRALVAVFDLARGNEAGAAALLHQLRLLARHSGLTFFSNADEAPAPAASDAGY